MPDDALHVLPGTPADLDTIVAIHAASFAASEHGHHGEADLVRALIDGGDSVVSLLAEKDGRPAGHVLFSRMNVMADGEPVSAVSLAPLAVLPDYRQRGVGDALVRAGHATLVDQGVELSFVLGDPHYYARFGYTTAAAAPFDSPYAGDHFMAVWLIGNGRKMRSWVATHAAPFAEPR